CPVSRFEFGGGSDLKREFNQPVGSENARHGYSAGPSCGARGWSMSRRRRRSARKQPFVPAILPWPRRRCSVGTTGNVQARSSRMAFFSRYLYDATTSTIRQFTFTSGRLIWWAQTHTAGTSDPDGQTGTSNLQR